MATSDQRPQLAAIFTLDQQTLIGQIVNTKISEMIASNSSLVCSHCSSNNSSNSQLPWSPEDSNVAVQTAPIQAFDKQLTTFKRQLSEQATKLQQFIANHSCNDVNTSNPSTNSVAANLVTSAKLIDKLASVEQRLTDLEYRCNKFESSIAQSSKLDPSSDSVDTTRLLEDIQAKFETTISQEHKQLTEFVQQLSQCTASADDVIELKAIVECMARVTETSEHIDVNQTTVLQSVAVDRHEVLSKLVSNIEHKHEELAEFVRQLSQCTASADDVIELKAVVECMARVTGVSEHKAEQLITQFIGREGAELEHLKRELRLVNDKILELQLARNQISNIHESAYHNQLPYLNVLTETMQGECERYKRDLDAVAKRLSERLNAKVAQAIKQSLVDKHQQNNKTQLSLPSTEGQDTKSQPSVTTCSSGKIPTEMLQPSADDGNTVTAAAAATEALNAETDLKRHLDEDVATSSPPPSAEKPAETDPKYTRIAVKSISGSESPFKQVVEPLPMQHLTTAILLQQQLNRFDDATIRQSHVGHWPVIKCLVVGHESALTGLLIQAYVKKTGSMITRTPGGVGVNVHVPVRYGTVDFNLHLDNCTQVEKLKQITVCDIIVICYSVVDRVSYKDVRNVWLKRIKIVYPVTPYLLVATQINQRQTTGVRHFQVAYEKGLQLSQKIEAVDYYECADLDGGGAEKVFNRAVKHVVDKLKSVSRPSISRLDERVNAKVAQAIQQSLVDKDQKNIEAQLSLPSTEGQDTKPRPSVSTRSSDKISTDILQPVFDDGSTVAAAAATAAVKAETGLKRYQDTHTQVKDTATSSPPPLAEKPAETSPKYKRMQRQDRLSNSNKPLDVAVKSVSRLESPFELAVEPPSMQQLTTTTQPQQQPNQFDIAMIWQSLVGNWPVIKCVVVGHESALTGLLIQAYVKKTGSMITRTPGGVGVNVHVPVRYGMVDFNLHLDICTRAKKLKQITVCDIIVMCYSVVDEVSYEDVQNVWLKQIKQVYPGKPYLLVGTHIDKRQRTGTRNFQAEYEQGLQLCGKIGAVAYFECSELDDDSAEAMFTYAVQHVVDKLKYVSTA